MDTELRRIAALEKAAERFEDRAEAIDRRILRFQLAGAPIAAAIVFGVLALAGVALEITTLWTSIAFGAVLLSGTFLYDIRDSVYCQAAEARGRKRPHLREILEKTVGGELLALTLPKEWQFEKMPFRFDSGVREVYVKQNRDGRVEFYEVVGA